MKPINPLDSFHRSISQGRAERMNFMNSGHTQSYNGNPGISSYSNFGDSRFKPSNSGLNPINNSYRVHIPKIFK